MRNDKMTEEEIKCALNSLSEYIVGQYNCGFNYGKQVSIIYGKEKNRKAKISIEFEFEE